MSVFTRDIGLDLGTASVLVYIKGKGIVLREPSVVAVDETTHTIIDVGTGALNMLGRTPRGISAIRPLKNGVICAPARGGVRAVGRDGTGAPQRSGGHDGRGLDGYAPD